MAALALLVLDEAAVPSIIGQGLLVEPGIFRSDAVHDGRAHPAIVQLVPRPAHAPPTLHPPN